MGMIFRRKKDPVHTPEFADYVKLACQLVKQAGARGLDKRDSVWSKVVGTPITSFGERDWAFEFRGRQVLGVCIYGSRITVHVGSDGINHNAHTALHEAGHVTLMQEGDYGHNPKYRPYFQGWSDTGHRLPAAADIEGTLAIVDYADGMGDLVMINDYDLAYLRNIGTDPEEAMA